MDIIFSQRHTWFWYKNWCIIRKYFEKKYNFTHRNGIFIKIFWKQEVYNNDRYWKKEYICNSQKRYTICRNIGSILLCFHVCFLSLYSKKNTNSKKLKLFYIFCYLCIFYCNYTVISHRICYWNLKHPKYHIHCWIHMFCKGYILFHIGACQ